MSAAFEDDCMAQAIAQARNNPQMPFGCILLQQKTGVAVATGYYNEELYLGAMWRDVLVALEKCNRAEAVPNAGGAPAVDFGDIVVYTTVEPDVLCWGAIMTYGIKKVVYGLSLSEITQNGPTRWIPIDQALLTNQGISCTRFSADALEQCEKLFAEN